MLGFLRDLTSRGLRPPLLTVSDGGPGLTAAIDQAYPSSLRQRCLVHRLGNPLAKVAAADADQVRIEYWRIFDDIHAPPGQAAVNEAERRAASFASRWRARYPRMTELLLDQLGHLTAHLRFPAEHWRRIRHTNLIERTQRVRPADGSRSSAGYQASTPASRWYGRCWTARRAAGAGST